MRLGVELGLEVGQVAAAAAAPGRIAALGHEAGDDSVEDHPVVEAVAGEAGDALDMAGGDIGPQLDDDVAAGRKRQGQGLGVGHRWSPKGRIAAL